MDFKIKLFNVMRYLDTMFVMSLSLRLGDSVEAERIIYDETASEY